MIEIDIAIPAHNCAAWLDDLIESILQQDASNWRIIARDDASTDHTAAHLSAWQQRLGDRMFVLPTGPNLGMVGNYDAVLSATTSRWVMFADPDDVWKPGKMAANIAAMHTIESAHGCDTPAVVCSDAEVVDAQLHLIAASYWKWSRMDPSLCRIFHRLLVDCPVLTSTMMVNRALLNVSLPMRGSAACPDWWHALVACAFGNIICLPQPTIAYRRHPQNDSVAPTTAKLSTAVTGVRSAHARIEKLIRQLAPQAGAFAKRFQGQLSSNNLETAQAANHLLFEGAMVRRLSVVRHKLWLGSGIKNVGLMLFM